MSDTIKIIIADDHVVVREGLRTLIQTEGGLEVIGEGTVRTHVSKILTKLHLANSTQAALYALREGFASLGNTP